MTAMVFLYGSGSAIQVSHGITDPEKVDNDGTIVMQSFGAQCFQMDPPANDNISEDCLFLNIYKLSKAALHEKDDDEASDSLQ
jgi:carboxylesterase type B